MDFMAGGGRGKGGGQIFKITGISLGLQQAWQLNGLSGLGAKIEEL